MSADRCNGVQHNVYLRQYYSPDNATPYSEYVRNLSWSSTPANVPRVAQRSESSRPFGNNTPLGRVAQRSELNKSFGNTPKPGFASRGQQYSAASLGRPHSYDPLHPHIHNVVNTSYTRHGSPRKFRPTMSSSQAQQRSTGPSAASPFPALNLSDQLPRTYRPTGGRGSTPLSRSASESNADAFFQGGKLRTAVSVYDQALTERPNDIWVLTKRCAALCHTGEYQRAYADAQLLCNIAPSAQARMRVNAIGKYMDSVWGRANATVGHETAHITLLQMVTPHTFKQW